MNECMNEIDRARARDRDRAREQKKPLLRPRLSHISPLSDISLSDFVARVLFLWVSLSRERAGNRKREGGWGTKGKKKERERLIDFRACLRPSRNILNVSIIFIIEYLI